MKINLKTDIKEYELVDDIRKQPQDIQKKFIQELINEFEGDFILLEAIYDNSVLSDIIVNDDDFIVLYSNSSGVKDYIDELVNEKVSEVELEKEELENSIEWYSKRVKELEDQLSKLQPQT